MADNSEIYRGQLNETTIRMPARRVDLLSSPCPGYAPEPSGHALYPDTLWKRDDWATLPVVSVSWFMAKRFVEEINKMDTQYRYRLPTDAEWEYVAKDGQDALRPVSIETLGDYAWFIQNSGDVPHPVATRKANRFGVYDMPGNAWEWVEDGYAGDTYSKTKHIDPTGPVNADAKVRRGGSYHCPLHLIRPGYRSANPPGTRYEVLGLRVIALPR